MIYTNHATVTFTARSRLVAFIRRHWVALAVVGVVFGAAVPAADATNGDPVVAGGNVNASRSTLVQTTAGAGFVGTTDDPATAGLLGVNYSGGYGVTGRANGSGVAMYADNTNASGTALLTNGRLRFQNRSGTTVIPAGALWKKVTLAGVSTASFILATVQRTGGYVAQAAVPAAGSFTIYLNKAAPLGQTVKVAYLVLN